jgi:multidrug efflux pump subunit AcrA (membrane-fusion protein)
LPPQAVRSFEGRRFVVVREGERQRRQDVKIGIVSSDRVEILDGLKAGDVIVGQ